MYAVLFMAITGAYPSPEAMLAAMRGALNAEPVDMDKAVDDYASRSGFHPHVRSPR